MSTSAFAAAAPSCSSTSFGSSEVRAIDDVLYCNCGDRVESCTALVERAGGSLEIIRRAQARDQTGAQKDAA